MSYNRGVGVANFVGTFACSIAGSYASSFVGNFTCTHAGCFASSFLASFKCSIVDSFSGSFGHLSTVSEVTSPLCNLGA